MPSLRTAPAGGRGADPAGRAKKRLFIGLVTGTSALVCLFLVLLWVVPYIGLATIHPSAPWVFGVVVLFALAMVLWASVGLVLNILSGRSLPLFGRMRGLTIRLFLPLMTFVGRALGISRDMIQSSFIKVNNELVAAKGGSFSPREILMLMPHCLQRSECGIKLTYNVRRCARCGKCPIAGLIALSDRYGMDLAVASGGTIARSIVIRKRPRLILAVACERDLSGGIRDVYPLPAYGILNIRPQGPCINTQVSMEHLEEAVRMFLAPGHLPDEESPVPASADSGARR